MEGFGRREGRSLVRVDGRCLRGRGGRMERWMEWFCGSVRAVRVACRFSGLRFFAVHRAERFLAVRFRFAVRFAAFLQNLRAQGLVACIGLGFRPVEKGSGGCLGSLFLRGEGPLILLLSLLLRMYTNLYICTRHMKKYVCMCLYACIYAYQYAYISANSQLGCRIRALLLGDFRQRFGDIGGVPCLHR